VKKKKRETERQRDRKKKNTYREREISNNEYFFIMFNYTAVHECTDLYLVYVMYVHTFVPSS